MIIDNVKCNFDENVFSPDEVKHYVDYTNEHIPPDYMLDELTVRLDPEDNMMVYLPHRIVPKIKFERIRRITGYLVGTTDRWNDAKRAEESERVKHL